MPPVLLGPELSNSRDAEGMVPPGNTLAGALCAKSPHLTGPASPTTAGAAVSCQALRVMPRRGKCHCRCQDILGYMLTEGHSNYFMQKEEEASAEYKGTSWYPRDSPKGWTRETRLSSFSTPFWASSLLLCSWLLCLSLPLATPQPPRLHLLYSRDPPRVAGCSSIPIPNSSKRI